MRLNLLIFSFLAVFGANVAFAAIDCSRAKSNVDKLICSSSSLGLAENQMALSYRQAMRRGVEPSQLWQTQLQWQQQVRDTCNDVPCLRKAFENRGAELDNY